ncbi:hypothetical protein K437DRAFT_292661 [Tilletiaria anomala UBC 951]|uniref:Uncharacterized protein n=1 Tax=Tilletiaria anomala (strain ATCC 24038 / CBS 436.72 / UBC 951) TaxID=1037660 RepID=A0A066WQR3_TILAU|nr:uncharacterized protein K437DRAFT_292661 [Tilletiaria anomala UBC 951]KDN52985.1 hypothetical protein K437DRAFT_292661 [Tilletiaria anomala UBC 951]
MSSSNARNHDSVPLLHADEDEADTRFTIAEEVEVREHHDRGESSSSGAAGRRISASESSLAGGGSIGGYRYEIQDSAGESASSSANAKYPPLPPSYDDVIRENRNKTSFYSTVSQHISSLPQCVPEGLRDSAKEGWRKLKMLVWKLWPSSRLAHTFLILAGLWVLVVLTGPSFESFSSGGDAGVAWKWEDIKPYEEPPLPFKGDGEIRQNATWTLEGCAAEADQSGWFWGTWCYSKTNFELTVPPSFGAGDRLYILADPPHGNVPSNDHRGTVRGVVRFVEEKEDRGPVGDGKARIKVHVKARYSKVAERYFRGVTVARIGLGRYDEGIGIYTRPSFPHMGRIGQQEPLTFEVIIRIPKHTPIPQFEVTTSAMDVVVFDGDAGDATSTETSALSSRHFDIIHSDRSTKTHFGNLYISSDAGLIGIGRSLGRPLRADGTVKLHTKTGNIAIAGDVAAQMLDFRSESGGIRLLKHIKVEAWREGTLMTQDAVIFLEQGSLVRGTTLVASTQNGRIDSNGRGIGRGVWYANHSLSLTSQTGHIGANIGVEKPQAAGFRPKEGFPRKVTVKTSTLESSVDIVYVEQADDVPLDVVAHSDKGAVSVALHPNFVGSVHLQGSSSSDAVNPNRGKGPKGHERHLEVNRKKEGWSKFMADGKIWRDNAKEIGEQSSVTVTTSVGRAKLRFDS